MTALLQNIFTSLLKNYSDDPDIIDECWKEIEKQYSGSRRFYHTLYHLVNLYEQLSEVKDRIRQWDTLLFTLFYHDIIYNSMRGDNEERSALVAEKRLKTLSVPTGIIRDCREQILATKKHVSSADDDTNYFIDADLSILGQPWEQYNIYRGQVRKEYSVYPDIVYNPGRKKVLQHFLDMPFIFKTGFFTSKFEMRARQNLFREIQIINS